MTAKKDLSLLHAEIDANLRKAYQQSLNEELPKRFIDLIETLRSGAADGGDNATDDEVDQ